jgi:hypothetical protein
MSEHIVDSDHQGPKVGGKYLIRTVTYFQIGEIISITGNWITLRQASWVADTGRFGAAIERGELSEVEYLGDDVSVNTGAIVDIIPWVHDLPTATK